MIDAPSRHKYAKTNPITPQFTEHTMLQSVGVYLRSVIDCYQAPACKLAKTLTEIQNAFMHLKCTCSIMYSEHMQWY
jgi:hypothetical protein